MVYKQDWDADGCRLLCIHLRPIFFWGWISIFWCVGFMSGNIVSLWPVCLPLVPHHLWTKTESSAIQCAIETRPPTHAIIQPKSDDKWWFGLGHSAQWITSPTAKLQEFAERQRSKWKVAPPQLGLHWSEQEGIDFASCWPPKNGKRFATKINYIFRGVWLWLWLGLLFFYSFWSVSSKTLFWLCPPVLVDESKSVWINVFSAVSCRH